MNTYVVTYDLDKPGQNYNSLKDAIELYPNWVKVTESCYCIQSYLKADEIAKDLKNKIDLNDKLFISEINLMNSETAGLDLSTSYWLIDRKYGK